MTLVSEARWIPRQWKFLAGVVLLLIAAVIAGLVWAARPTIARVTRPTAASFSPALVAKGRALAMIGDCAVCHAAPDGRAYAGGGPIATPFGTVYASNITPDETTGIGDWSEPAFRRALREGVSRNGTHLYPALPYDHFNTLSDGDVEALYAFLMTRPAVEARKPANRLIPPLGIRPLLAGWKALFLRPQPVKADPSRPPDWNRGHYLVDALAHCGSCHTPRNALGVERADKLFAGGWADGWYAPPLNAASPALRAWTPERLHLYLRTGLDPDHAAAAGPMGPVTHGLSKAPEADVRAIAVYIASLSGRTEDGAPVEQAEAAARAHPQAVQLFEGSCAGCHDPGAAMMTAGRPSLSLGTPMREDNPRDTMQIVSKGLSPPVGRQGPYMPPFALTDAQLGDLAAYLRARYTTLPPWPGNLTRPAAKARKEGVR
jgi:nicotinate dehydrogenase subunit B